MSRAVKPQFDEALLIDVKRAFLSCSGPLMARAVAHVRVGQHQFSTGAAQLSATPEWNDSRTVVVPARSKHASVVIVVEDSLTGRFLGQATIPSSVGGDYQAMLEPRMAATAGDVLSEDADVLAANGHDDFGYICARIVRETIPSAPPGMALGHQQSELPAGITFPIGCALRVAWLSPDADSGRYSVSASFGGHGDFPVGSAAPLFVSVGSVADSVVTLRGTHKSSGNETAFQSKFRLPLHLMNVSTDIALPVVEDGASGLLVVTVALTPKPEIPPAPAGRDFGRAPPDTPPTLFHAAPWESEAHIARGTERRWQRSTVVEAAAQPEHLRHLLDTIKARSELSPSLLPIVRAFYNLPAGGADGRVTCDLRQLLVALAFACNGIEPRDAALFVFEAVATPNNGITLDGVELLLENCLLPRTLDMSQAEVRRRASDLFLAYAPLCSSSSELSLTAFDAAVARNLGLWHALGAPLETGPAPASRAPKSGATADDDTWRHFVIRVASNNLAFAVTAHKDDTFQRVTKQIEGSVGIVANKQVLQQDRAVLDLDCRVGAVIAPSAQAVQQVVVSEAKDTVSLTCVYRAKSQKFALSVKPADKILKLRAAVQQRTNIPLSRISLTFGGSELLDRHPLSHYGAFDGSVIEIKSV